MISWNFNLTCRHSDFWAHNFELRKKVTLHVCFFNYLMLFRRTRHRGHCLYHKQSVFPYDFLRHAAIYKLSSWVKTMCKLCLLSFLFWHFCICERTFWLKCMYLTHFSLTELPTRINWTRPFPFKGCIFHFYQANTGDLDQKPLSAWSDLGLHCSAKYVPQKRMLGLHYMCLLLQLFVMKGFDILSYNSLFNSFIAVVDFCRLLITLWKIIISILSPW